jgi:hypothetical protein
LTTNRDKAVEKPLGGLDWWGLLSGLILIVAGAIISAISFVLGRLYERMKPLHFQVFDWELSFIDRNKPRGSECHDIKIVGRENVSDIRIDFKVIFFNKKANPISLNKLHIEFRDCCGMVCEPKELFFKVGPDYTRVDENRAHYIDLPSHESRRVVFWGGLPKEELDNVLASKSVWFIAESTERKGMIRRWLIAILK